MKKLKKKERKFMMRLIKGGLKSKCALFNNALHLLGFAYCFGFIGKKVLLKGLAKYEATEQLIYEIETRLEEKV